MGTNERDCNNCIWSSRDGNCSSWECEFVRNRDAYEAWKEKRDGNVCENVKGHVITRLDTREYGKTINMYFCSVCGKQMFLPQNYCPNCGADMRGDDNAPT